MDFEVCCGPSKTVPIGSKWPDWLDAPENGGSAQAAQLLADRPKLLPANLSGTQLPLSPKYRVSRSESGALCASSLLTETAEFSPDAMAEDAEAQVCCADVCCFEVSLLGLA